MNNLLAIFFLFLTMIDHWTTYCCLKAPVPGWEISEWNPISAWLFQQAGLVSGLMLDFLVTLAALAMLLYLPVIKRRIKILLLLVACGVTGFAVVNNLHVMRVVGL
jgi:hypothetical protein